METGLEIALTVRDFEPTDLTELDWTGGETHLQAIAGDLVLQYTGEKVQLVIELPNRLLVGHGAVDFRSHADSGKIMMLAVHPTWQRLGVGTTLITALEDRIRAAGCPVARIAVEHDNPRAAVLYRRLGYREVGDELDHWSEGHGRTYVTVCTVLEKRL